MAETPQVKILTDSTSDLTQEDAKKYGISIIPLTVNMDDQILRDGIDILPQEFYKRLPSVKKMPTTSQPPAGLFEQFYKELTADGSKVISIHISSRMSGTYNSANLAAQSFPEGQITVIDTKWVSAALALPVIKAAKMVKEGKEFSEIVEEVKAASQRVSLLAVADTLEYLKKNGRIGGLAALAGGLLSVKPIFTVLDGAVERFENVRTKKKALQRIADTVKTWGPLESAAIMHADSPDEATELAAMLTSVYPTGEFYISMVGPVVGTNTGPKTMGIAAIRKKV